LERGGQNGKGQDIFASKKSNLGLEGMNGKDKTRNEKVWEGERTLTHPHLGGRPTEKRCHDDPERLRRKKFLKKGMHQHYWKRKN